MVSPLGARTREFSSPKGTLPGDTPAVSSRGRALRIGARVLGGALALLGTTVVLWAVLSPILGLSLVVFATGSMSPTIPTGSLAVVHRAAAGDLEIGQIAMLQRPGERPVTHRIVAIEPGPEPDQRLVTMRGDANAVDDPDPYVVDQGAVVLASVPHGAVFVGFVRSPFTMGVLTAVAAALVLRAFWPVGS